MKKCKHCQSEIDDKAKICPNCRKKQKKPIWLIVVIVVFALIIFSPSGEESSDSNEEKKTGTTTSSEKLTLLDGHSGAADSEYSYEITGTIKNNTNRDYSYVQVEFYAYDGAGNLLDTCLANNSGLESNGTWKFTASCFFSNGNSSDVASYKLKEITKW